ncbi:hypothetical protein [Arthrobacter sp. 92]|uniref:hypothetical protein n=1 Tax=Arthrobacter sp. 92 TaxID=3418175 RepID=UPI003D094D73
MSAPNPKEMRLGDADFWFRWLGVAAMSGAVVTTGLVADFAKSSPYPWLIIAASATCLFLSLTLVVGLRKGGRGLVLLFVLTVLSAVGTWYAVQEFAHKFASGAIPVSQWFWVTSSGTIAVAVVAVTLFICKRKDLYNPKITLTKNGLSLILVLLSALAFSLPDKWGPPIGWIIIAATMISLGPIWKSEAQAAAEINGLELEILRLKNEVINRKATLGNGSLSPKNRKAKGNK